MNRLKVLLVITFSRRKPSARRCLEAVNGNKEGVLLLDQRERKENITKQK